jgi:hypothetical protein
LAWLICDPAGEGGSPACEMTGVSWAQVAHTYNPSYLGG